MISAMRRAAVFGAALACGALCAAISAAPARAQTSDKLKLAVGGFGSWAVEAARLGVQSGIFRKHNLEVEYYATAGAGESLQAVISNSADLSIGVGTAGVLGAFAKGAPIRIIGANFKGSGDVYWYTRADSPIRALKDATDKDIIAYSSNGSSTHIAVSGLIEEAGVKAKPLATGDMASTLTQVMSGQIALGWAAPPFGLREVGEGKIRIVGTGNEAPSLREQTVRVDIASVRVMSERKEALARYVKAYRETLDWMFSDKKAVEMWAANIGVPVNLAEIAARDYQPKAARDFDVIVGLDLLMAGAVKQKFLTAPLTKEQIATLVQIVK